MQSSWGSRRERAYLTAILTPDPRRPGRHPDPRPQLPGHLPGQKRLMLSYAGPTAASPVESGRPDLILVREARGGDSRAYGELVRRYQDRVYTLIYGLIQNHDDALDLTQDVFVRAHGSLARFREEAVFYTWLYRIALNACIDFNRRKKRSGEPFSLDGDTLGEGGSEP